MKDRQTDTHTDTQTHRQTEWWGEKHNTFFQRYNKVLFYTFTFLSNLHNQPIRLFCKCLTRHKIYCVNCFLVCRLVAIFHMNVDKNLLLVPYYFDFQFILWFILWILNWFAFRGRTNMSVRITYIVFIWRHHVSMLTNNPFSLLKFPVKYTRITCFGLWTLHVKRMFYFLTRGPSDSRTFWLPGLLTYRRTPMSVPELFIRLPARLLFYKNMYGGFVVPNITTEDSRNGICIPVASFDYTILHSITDNVFYRLANDKKFIPAETSCELFHLWWDSSDTALLLN